MELKTEIINLKSKIESEKQNNNDNHIKSKKGIHLINTSSNINLDNKYSETLQKLVKANSEVQKLKKRIEQLEKEKNNLQKESLFKFKSLKDLDDDEEEIDMIQLKEGVKRKNRSEDLKIDFPGYNEYQKKYEEMKDKFNKLKEQIISLLKENLRNNDKIATKNNVTTVCELLCISVNTTNEILQNYK